MANPIDITSISLLAPPFSPPVLPPVPTPILNFAGVLDSLCPRWSPLKLGGWLRTWLTQHFSLTSNIYETALLPNLQPWVNQDTTGIMIETIARWKPTLTEKRPAIILKRHDLNVMKQGLHNDLLMGDPNGLYNFATLMAGSHTAYCISRAEGQCELLASEVYHELIQFASIMRAKLDFIRIGVVGVGELAELEEASENFVIPVTLAYAYQDKWQVNPQNRQLNQIVLTPEI